MSEWPKLKDLPYRTDGYRDPRFPDDFEIEPHVLMGPEIGHKGGVPWWKADLPRRFHRCRPQTIGWATAGAPTCYRCACGAMGEAYKGRLSWVDRNARRKG